MARLLGIALTGLVLLTSGGGAIAPTPLWAAAMAEPAASASLVDGLWDSLVDGVAGLFGSEPATPTPSAPSPPAAAATPPDPGPEPTPVTAPVAAPAPAAVTAPHDRNLERAVERIEHRLRRIDQRAGQSRTLGWAMLGLTVAVLGLLGLVVAGRIGWGGAASAADRAVMRDLRRIRQRQAVLTAAIGHLHEFVIQSSEDRSQFNGLLAAVTAELKALDHVTAEIQAQRE